MDLWQALRKRHSVRAFAADQPVSDEMVARLLEAAIEAPSAGNRQPWHFYVVRDAGMRAALSEAAFGQESVATAPIDIVVCAEPERSAKRYGERGSSLYCLQDTAAATQNLLLAATALGLATCWVGAFDEERARRALKLPDDRRPVVIIPLGYPAAPSERSTSRRPVNEVATYV